MTQPQSSSGFSSRSGAQQAPSYSSESGDSFVPCAFCPNEADGKARIAMLKQVSDGMFAIILDTLPLCRTCYDELKRSERHADVLRDLVQV